MARTESPDEPDAGTAGTQSPAKLARHIRDVGFPATKDDMLAKARSAAAPREVVEAIQRLPGSRFNTLDDVLIAYAEIHERAGP